MHSEKDQAERRAEQSREPSGVEGKAKQEGKVGAGQSGGAQQGSGAPWALRYFLPCICFSTLLLLLLTMWQVSEQKSFSLRSPLDKTRSTRIHVSPDFARRHLQESC